MPDTLPPFLAHAFPGWLAARRHAAPPALVAAAAERRAAGDWHGACAAARFVVRVDPNGVRAAHGAAVADALVEDLRHLVPDLIRWHLPRELRGGIGRVLADEPVLLARYGDEPDAPALWVRTPVHLERPLRPELRFGPLDPTDIAVEMNRWDDARYLWDDRATDGLRRRLGSDERTAFFHRDGRPLAADELPTVAPAPDGDPAALLEWVLLRYDEGRYDEAWSAAGIAASLADSNDNFRWARGHADVQRNLMAPQLAAELRRRLVGDPDGAAWFAFQRTSHYASTLIVTAMRSGLSADMVQGDVDKEVTIVPHVHAARLPDLDLLRTGRLTLGGLHPLVRAALFPDAPGVEYRPGGAVAAPGPVRVRCREGWHRIGWRDGRVEPHDHTPDEVRRERTMRALGGVVPRCFTVTETWQGTGSGRLPRKLARLRSEALRAIEHGDTGAFLGLLDRGVDPAGVRNRRGRTALHLLAHLDGPGVDTAALVRRLLATGLDVDVKDVIGRTPLGAVLFDGASAALVRALLDAGANATHIDDMGDTPLHLVRSLDAAAIVPLLVKAGGDLEATDEYGRTPLMTQIISQAPPEAVRAMIDAGADIFAADEYSEMSIGDLIDDHTDHDDLSFLVAAIEDAE